MNTPNDSCNLPGKHFGQGKQFFEQPSLEFIDGFKGSTYTKQAVKKPADKTVASELFHLMRQVTQKKLSPENTRQACKELLRHRRDKNYYEIVFTGNRVPHTEPREN